MLSEGWDAITVTHIMGLRAFSSQLLCEQVVGRGLRRTSYEINPDTGLFDAESVTIFGIPFTFLRHETDHGTIPKPILPKTLIEAVKEKARYAIKSPNVVRVEYVNRARLELDLEGVEPLVIDATEIPRLAERAPVLEGKSDLERIAVIDLDRLAAESRMQRIIFETVAGVVPEMKRDGKGSEAQLVGQIIRVVEKFIPSNKMRVLPETLSLRTRRLAMALSMGKVVRHLGREVRFQNTEKVELDLISRHQFCQPRTCEAGTRHASLSLRRSLTSTSVCVTVTLEARAALQLDKHPDVAAWVKNGHLGFEVFYLYRGVVRKYRPEFIVRLKPEHFLIIETKGQMTEQAEAMQRYMEEWVTAVTAHGGFGKWSFAVAQTPQGKMTRPA